MTSSDATGRGYSARAVAETLAALRDGPMGAEALVRCCLDRIAGRDGVVRAWTHLDPDNVLAEARALDAARVRGPLHGLPVGVKDVIAVAGMPTRHNSSIHASAVPEANDAACVALLRRAGALVLGKTATVEFAAIGAPPSTRNPHDPARTPGGSSSGSAAAVADGHVPLALATQTGGSTIRPASYCGVWGMKPTWGLVSNEGCKRFAPTLDTLGWFARSADDLRLMLDVFDPCPPSPAALRFDLGEARIAVCRAPSWSRAEPATRVALADAVARLREAGAQVNDLEPPPPFHRLPELQRIVMRAEGRVSFQPERERLTGRMREMANGAEVASPAELIAAYDAAAAARAAFDELVSTFDAVLAPSADGEAPEGLALTGDLAFQGLWTLLHVPAVNVPGWRGPAGLPVGLTVTGPRFADRRVLAAAEALGALVKA